MPLYQTFVAADDGAGTVLPSLVVTLAVCGGRVKLRIIDENK